MLPICGLAYQPPGVGFPLTVPGQSLRFVVIYSKSGHVREAHQQELEVCYVLFIVLDRNECVVRVLKMRDSSRSEVQRHPLNVARSRSPQP
jgi:hypothetical protein